MKNQLKKIALIAGLAITSALTTLAQPYYIVGNVVNGWADPGTVLMTSNSPTFWSYSVTGGTPGNYEELKVTVGNWGTTWPGNNLKIKLDGSGANTIYFYPVVAGDGWLPTGYRVGYADPGNMAWEIAGDFNGYGGGAGYDLPAIGGGVYSNTIVIPTAGVHAFKFRSQGAWDTAFGSPDMGVFNGDFSYTTTNSPQSVPMVVDMTNGRYLVGTLVAPPVTNQVVFLVDMSVQLHQGMFDPATDRVCVSGAFNGWPGIGPTALTLTNDPTWGGNTNIYYATNVFIGTPSAFASAYKFTDTNPSQSGSGGYEPRTQDRSFNLLPANGVLVLPVVYFGDASTNDYLAVDTLVTFNLNMAGRTSISNVTFDPAIHPPPYINGNFLTNGWIATWNPISLAPVQMTENPIGSTNYQFSYLVPKGHLVRVQYKCGFDDGVNSLDNEALSFQDKARFIRTTATGTYAMPKDNFGDQYNEPSFGELSVGPASGGTVPVKWLGRPGVRLQSTTSLTGSWTDHFQTDGTNWSIGASSTNGLVSSTNWPAGSGNRLFRLIKQ